MFIFFYMNISLFLRDAGASVRDIFKSNKTKMLVYVAIFVAGMILGFIFFNRIEQTEWLYVHTTDIVIVVNLFSFGRHFHFLLIIIRGIVLGVGSVVLIAEFGFMGGVYLAVVFVTRSAFMFACIFVGKYICVYEGGCLNRDWWHTAKKYLLMLVICLVFCLASALVVFLVLRPLFAVG